MKNIFTFILPSQTIFLKLKNIFTTTMFKCIPHFTTPYSISNSSFFSPKISLCSWDSYHLQCPLEATKRTFLRFIPIGKIRRIQILSWPSLWRIIVPKERRRGSLLLISPICSRSIRILGGHWGLDLDSLIDGIGFNLDSVLLRFFIIYIAKRNNYNKIQCLEAA